jgi:hypothetical protein
MKDLAKILIKASPKLTDAYLDGVYGKGFSKTLNETEKNKQSTMTFEEFKEVFLKDRPNIFISEDEMKLYYKLAKQMEENKKDIVQGFKEDLGDLKVDNDE